MELVAAGCSRSRKVGVQRGKERFCVLLLGCVSQPRMDLICRQEPDPVQLLGNSCARRQEDLPARCGPTAAFQWAGRPSQPSGQHGRHKPRLGPCVPPVQLCVLVKPGPATEACSCKALFRERGFDPPPQIFALLTKPGRVSGLGLRIFTVCPGPILPGK